MRPDHVHGAGEQAVGIGDIQDRRWGGARFTTVTYEDLELVADVFGTEIMHLGVGQRREIVVGHQRLLSNDLSPDHLHSLPRPRRPCGRLPF